MLKNTTQSNKEKSETKVDLEGGLIYCDMAQFELQSRMPPHFNHLFVARVLIVSDAHIAGKRLTIQTLIIYLH